MLAKAILESITDSTELQLVKVDLGSESAQSNIDRIGEYGLTSRPSKGAQAIVLFVEGRRDNPVVVGIDDGRYRVKLDAEGEVALYSRFGNKIVMKADGSIEATPAPGQNFKINGVLVATDVWAGTVGAYSKLLSHTHAITSAPGTSAPPTPIP